MKDCNYRPDGTGVVMGDTKAVPNKGTGTGMTGYATHNDKSIGQDATNSMGGISGATGSDAADACHNTDPTFGKQKGGKEGY